MQCMYACNAIVRVCVCVCACAGVRVRASVHVSVYGVHTCVHAYVHAFVYMCVYSWFMQQGLMQDKIIASFGGHMDVNC